jgi:hypothetical protein
MSTASEWMKEYVWSEIQAMMLNDAHFRLVLKARQLTGKLKGPTGKLIDDGYLTFQMVTIRRLCDQGDDVYSLRAVLKKAKEEKPDLAKQIDQLSGSLSTCDHVVPRHGFSWERGRFRGALFRGNWHVGYGVI